MTKRERNKKAKEIRRQRMEGEERRSFLSKQKKVLEESLAKLLLRHANQMAAMGARNEGPMDLQDAANYLAQQWDDVVSTDQLSRDIKQAQAAIRRIEDGGYGVCIDCNTDIPQKRLEANSSFVRCVSCQDRIEKEEKEEERVRQEKKYYYPRASRAIHTPGYA